MKNNITRKLTSLTLMMIMVAGGLTFAIPGALPQAVAQTGMISVSSTEMGGYQILEVQVNDPDKKDRDVPYGNIGVTIDDDPLAMLQADTGIWYAYVQQAGVEGDITITPTSPPEINTVGGSGQTATTYTVHTTSDLRDGFTIAYGDESVDITYDDDLTGSVAITTDREDVPNNAQVHITITDPRLNLDPTVKDAWQLSDAEDDSNYRNGDSSANFVPAPLSNGHGEFSHGDLTIPDGATFVTFEETESSSGVFVSSYDSDTSTTTINFGGEGEPEEQEKVTVEYAGKSADLYGTDVDPTIALVGDGPWNSGDAITVRLTAPNLNLNTLDEENRALTDPQVPIITIDNSDEYDPLTIADIANANGTTSESKIFKFADADTDSDQITFEFMLGDLRVDNDLKHYVNYYTDGAGTLSVTFENDDDPNNDQISAFNTTGNADAPAFAFANEDTVSTDLITLSDGVNATTPLTLRVANAAVDDVLIFDIFSFGQDKDSIAENDPDGDVYTLAVYRPLLEETTAASGVFEGTVEYIMLTQANINKASTYAELDTASSSLVIVLDDDEGAEVRYDEATSSYDSETHTASVTLDADSYATNGAIVVTLVDADLNMDSGSSERYVLTDSGTVRGSENPDEPGLFLEIEIDDKQWSFGCEDDTTNFPSALTFQETEKASGTFTTDFAIPTEYCYEVTADAPVVAPVTGKSIRVIYTDFRNDEGSFDTWSDSATIQAITGTISLDRTVYPVPTANANDDNVMVHIEINDPDHNTDSDRINTIDTGVEVKITPLNAANPINIDSAVGTDAFEETSEDSGIFSRTIELSGTVTLDKGTTDTTDDTVISIGQSYILSVTYTDPHDATGTDSEVTASAIFNLGNAELSTDLTEYTIKQTAFITLVDRDRNYDSEERETIELTDIDWGGSADTTLSNSAFDASPPNLKETEPNSGIFLTEITIPMDIKETEDSAEEEVQRGESVTLTYVDYSPAGNDRPSDDRGRDVETSFTISRTGASLTLDKDVYSWRDRVTITVVAPDFNLDSLAVEPIPHDKVQARSQQGAYDNDINLRETGPNTGIFQDTIDLGGFKDGYNVGDATVTCQPSLHLCVGNEDGISVTFTYDDDERDLIQSALVRWSAAEVTWLEDSYKEGSTGTLRVVDPDRNLHADTPDSINTIVYSDTFRGGIKVPLTETEPANGIFEGEIIFDVLHSEGNRLQVSEGDIVTASYDDRTLPPPDSEGDRLRITGTTTIGSIVPPLERVGVSNLGVVDALGTAVDSVSVGQQVNIAADLTSAQSRSQDYAYLLQIQNMDGVTVHLSWAASSLAGFGGANVSQSWTPDEAGSYTATVFVWESLTNPTALSPQNSIDITVV